MVREILDESVHCGLQVVKSSLDMDASLMFQNLLDHNAAKRVEILIVMRKLVKNSNGHLPFRNTTRNAVFEVLHHVLDDVRWEVRYQCLLLISAIIPNADDELDSCMHFVLPKIISNLGHENMNIRRAALQVLHVHMKFTNNLQHFQRMFIQHGLDSNDYVTRKGCIMSIGILFTGEFANENLCSVVDCLAKHFVHGDASLFYPIFLAMQKLNELVGPITFESYLQRLDVEAVNTYKRVLNKFYNSDSYLSNISFNHSTMSGNLNGSFYGSKKSGKHDFGIFEPQIIEKIRNEDWKTRIEGVEHMKIILKDTPDLNVQIADMDEFLIFLSKLLEDSNFKIVILTLSLYDLLIDKFRKELKKFLKTFVSSFLRRLGDSKIVVREHAIKVIHKLMHHVRPTEVLSNLLENKCHRNPRLREEIINRITAAVLTFPSYSFEFSVLCESVAPLLVDSKRRVRLAALECFAVLAQAMGPTRMIPLITAVDAVELNFDGEGLLAAVQARLARRILPRCTEDGAVSYAVTIPSSAGCQSRSISPCGADVEWVMMASGSSSSSTPPSRSKETTFSGLVHLNRDPAVRMKSEFVKFRSQDPLNICEVEETQKIPDEDNYSVPFLSSVTQNTESNQERKTLSSHDLHISSKTKPESSVTPRNQKGSAHLGDTLLPNRIRISSENIKNRPVASNSKIPILASNSVHRNVTIGESPILLKPTIARTLSAGRRNLLPTHRSKYSAAMRKFSHHNLYHDDVPKLEFERNEVHSMLRKVSPDNDSPFGSKPILVRSPSLTHLHHLPQKDLSSTTFSYDGNCTPPSENMGNISSYFRPNPGGVIVAQPTSIHLDDVSDINVIGVAVLDENLKVPLSSSPSPQSWPSAELFKPGSGDSAKDETWQKPAASLPEVYGMHMNFPSPTNHSFHSQEILTSPLNGMDNSNISISKITREKMLKRQQEILKEAEERRVARERDQQERKQMLERRLHEERERQRQQSEETVIDERWDEQEEHSLLANSERKESKCNRPGSDNSLKCETLPLKVTPPPETSVDAIHTKQAETAVDKEGLLKPLSRSSSLKTPSTLRKFSQLSQPSMKNLSIMSKHNLAASSLALFDDSQTGISPYPHPDEALRKALKSLATETWMGKIEGIQTISRLSHFHPNVLQAQLHPVVLALLTEVKNLRSSVSRAAILTMGDLFITLKRSMESDLDLITSTLLSKSGETVGFIRDDIEKVMKHLIEGVTLNKAALAIIAGGASHRNGAVRKTAAQSLLSVVEKMGAGRILTTAKDVTERLLPATAQFLMDGMPLTRYYGRRIFQLLMTHPTFDKMLMRYVQPSTLRNIHSILDSVRKKGAGEMPKEGVSAKSHKSEVHRTGLLNRTM